MSTVKSPDVDPVRNEFYQRLQAQAMAPLWETMSTLVASEPQPACSPYIWHYDRVRSHLMEAGSLLTAQEAERRVLVLENPDYRGRSQATNTLYAGVQLVLPGEVAPAHRHTASALRFVLESDGGATVVDGEEARMMPGDFVITPSWAWHDHRNQSQAAAIWVDVLDVPIVNFFRSGFSEHYNDSTQAIRRASGTSLARYGANMLPVELSNPFGLTSPIFSYPFEQARSALVKLASAGATDPHLGATLRYSNPLDGGWAMPTIACWMTHLPAAARTTRIRSTDAQVVVVAEGRGSVAIGDKSIEFGPKDILVIPNWTWRSFKVEEACFLFTASDRVAQEKYGIWREERAST